MAHWTKYSAAVHRERARLRAQGYGQPGAQPDLPSPDSYTQQALHELARRLEIEDALATVRQQLAAMTDRMEAVECALDILRRTHQDVTAHAADAVWRGEVG